MANPPKRKAGRPPKPESEKRRLVEAVCARVARGELTKYAAEAEGTHASKIRQWALDSKEYGALYAHAREQQAHSLAEQAVAISDGEDALTQFYEAGVDEVEKEIAASGVPFAAQNAKQAANQLRRNIIDRDKLRLDSRKWLTSKIAPKLYGEKLDVTSDGKALPATQTVVIGDRTIAF